VSGPVAAARSSTETATLALGERIGTRLEPGDLILLSGQLGAGKTVLVRGIAAGMGIDPALVRSPTFVLHHIYRAGAKVLHHIDLYRLGPSADIRLLDIDEMLQSGGVVVVEWGEHASRDQEAPARISIAIDADGSRLISLTSGGSQRLSDAWDDGARR
jgi:tRNA threonylcarbamoyladenosine biosynthesis protein TsaE